MPYQTEMSPCYLCKYNGQCKECFHRAYEKMYAHYYKGKSVDISDDEIAKNQDLFIENLWRENVDIVWNENTDGELVLGQPWRGFPVDEFTQTDWFYWVDKHHSKGVGWVYENISLYDFRKGI